MMNVTRRNLVMTAGGVLAATAVGGPVWANPERKLGYAIVGLGGYGLGIIIPQFKYCQHSKLVALVSGDAVKAKKVAGEYGVPEAHIYDYKNYDRIRTIPRSTSSTSACRYRCTPNTRFVAPGPASTCCAKSRWRCRPSNAKA